MEGFHKQSFEKYLGTKTCKKKEMENERLSLADLEDFFRKVLGKEFLHRRPAGGYKFVFGMFCGNVFCRIAALRADMLWADMF